MRTIETYFYPLITIIYLVLFIWSYHTFRDSSYWGTSWLLFLIVIFIYENAIFSLGSLLQASPFLETLHLLRYLFKVFFTPTLVFIAWDILRRIQVEWSEYLSARILFNAYTFLITIIGILTEILWSPLHPVHPSSGPIRYEPIDPLFPYTSTLILIPLFIAGFYVWKKERWPLLLSSVILSILLGSLFLFTQVYLFTALAKLIFISGLVLTEWTLRHEDYL